MRISDWSSDVCSSDLCDARRPQPVRADDRHPAAAQRDHDQDTTRLRPQTGHGHRDHRYQRRDRGDLQRSEEHTSELQSLMRISYAVFCLKNTQYEITNKNKNKTYTITCKKLNKTK